MSKPTIKSLTEELATTKKTLADTQYNLSQKTREWTYSENQLADAKEVVKNKDLTIKNLEEELSVSRGQTNQVIFSLRARLSFLRDLRDLRANFVNALEVGAPADVIEKLRMDFHASMVDLVTLDISEFDVEAIMQQLSYSCCNRFQSIGENTMSLSSRQPLLYPKNPRTPYGA